MTEQKKSGRKQQKKREKRVRGSKRMRASSVWPGNFNVFAFGDKPKRSYFSGMLSW